MRSQERLDAVRVRLANPGGLNVELFANDQVPIDRQSIDEVCAFSRISETLYALNRLGFFDLEAEVRRIALMPDFHKGAGVAVGSVIDTYGFVLPRAPGVDIGCGVRILVLDFSQDEFARLDAADVDRRLRHVFFEGGRDLALTPSQRTQLLRDGLPGLHPESRIGLWRWYDPAAYRESLARCHGDGHWPTSGIFGLDDYIQGSGNRASHDDVLGAVGGGNHFAEIGFVSEIQDRHLAYDWSLKKGALTLMVHTGSLSIGQLVGKHFMDLARDIFPTALTRPTHGFNPLPTHGKHSDLGYAFLSAMGNATNLAFANRLFVGLMVIRCLSEAAGREIGWHLVYDSPHNLIWSDEQEHRHRKGAAPAGEHPVIVPGSMGSDSYVLKGCGNTASLCSAPHGAGRAVTRGSARRQAQDEIERLRIVGKIDPKKARRDVAAEFTKGMMEEAPSCYKGILPVIETVIAAGIATPVARLSPLLTVKG